MSDLFLREMDGGAFEAASRSTDLSMETRGEALVM